MQRAATADTTSSTATPEKADEEGVDVSLSESEGQTPVAAATRGGALLQMQAEYLRLWLQLALTKQGRAAGLPPADGVPLQQGEVVS
jgi:hypothetical protein